MSYTHTLTETHQQKPRKPKLTFDNYKKNRLGDQTYENMTKQQKQQRRKKRFLENYKKNTKMNLKNSNVDEISTDSKEFSNRSQIFNKNSNIDEISTDSKEFSNPENFNSEMKKTLENYTLSTMMISFVTMVGMLFL